MIDNKLTNETIGTVDLFEFDPLNLRAGIGILIANVKDRNQGLGKAALELIIDYSFNMLQLQQLFCNIEVSNESSISLFQSKGFVISGTKKDWNMKNGYWEDEHFLQLLNRSQYPKSK